MKTGSDLGFIVLYGGGGGGAAVVAAVSVDASAAAVAAAASLAATATASATTASAGGGDLGCGSEAVFLLFHMSQDILSILMDRICSQYADSLTDEVVMGAGMPEEDNFDLRWSLPGPTLGYIYIGNIIQFLSSIYLYT